MANSIKDKVMSSLAEFIAIKESGGNYDAYIGNSRATGTFAGKTIDDVYTFQRSLVAAGKPSSAVGKYQAIQRTLNSVVQNLRIPTTAEFTPAVQDAVAEFLMRGRGYDSWLAHKISDATFMHNLSCEWASLPDPFNGGKSHYDGVGPNHAGQTLAAFQIALDTARRQAG